MDEKESHIYLVPDVASQPVEGEERHVRQAYVSRHPAAQTGAVKAAAERLIGMHSGSYIQEPEDAVQAGVEQHYSDRQTFGDTAENFRDASILFGAFQEAVNERLYNLERTEQPQVNQTDIEEEIIMRVAYGKLDDVEREVLTAIFNGLSVKKTAESLQVSEDGVPHLYNSAMQKIAAELQNNDSSDYSNVAYLLTAPDHDQQD